MTMETFEQIEPKEHFSFGHLGMVLSVAVLLIGLSWMKNPDLFDVFKSKPANSSISANIPQYYAYQTPEKYNQPLVAGASTQDQGPMVINEDGSLSPAVPTGDVLGASTNDVVLNVDAIAVKQIADSEENIKAYIASVQGIEGGYLDSIQFEAALASGNQAEIDKQALQVQQITDKLLPLGVPASLVNFHKLKILQYQAALEILKNFTKADENPELITKNLSIFLKTEQQIQAEAAQLKDKLDSIIQQ